MFETPSRAADSKWSRLRRFVESAVVGPCRGIWWAGVNLFLPPACAFCGVDIEPSDREPLLCDSCIDRFVPDKQSFCRRCGIIASTSPCNHCRTQNYHFEGVVPLGCYRRELRQAVLRMKHRTNDHLTIAVARLMTGRCAEELSSLTVDVVVPIPMHWRRQLRRGTNSPDIVARRISRHLGVPLEANMLIRAKLTGLQAELSPRQRFENVRGAFKLRTGYAFEEGTRVLLVDDVMTTGATCSEAAKVLHQAGVSTVYAAVVARTLGPSGPS